MVHMLRVYRQQNKLSLAAVAAAVGVSKATIGRIEQGLQTPSLELMFRLVNETNGAVTPNDFMPGVRLPDVEPAPSNEAAE
jgi:transcriptional regulator with XRE-family HTH domain